MILSPLYTTRRPVMGRLRVLLLSFCVAAFLPQASARCECIDKIVMLLDAEDYRTLASPDFPRNYCPDLDCSWRIVGPANDTKVHFLAEQIDLGEGDRVLLYESLRMMRRGIEDESDEEEQPAHVCTHGDTSCFFVSSTLHMTVRLVSGPGENEHRGFQATVSTNDRRQAFLGGILSYSLYLLAALLAISVLVLLLLFICCCHRSSSSSPSSRREGTSDKLIP